MKKKKRKNLKFNVSNYYAAIALFFVLGIVFFGTSKIFFAEERPINQTPLQTELDLRANGKLSIDRWIYDEHQNKMEVILATNNMKDYRTDLQFSSVSRKDVRTPLSIQAVYEDNEIFILHIDQVPKDFEQLAIRLHKNERNLNDWFQEQEEEEKQTPVISTLYTDERVVEKGEVNVKDHRDYTRQVADQMIDQSTIKIKENEEKMEQWEEVYRELNEEKEKLKAGLLYQTMDEQITTNNKIYQLDREMDVKQKEIEKIEADSQNIRAKIERLKQKKRDIGF
ncbi:hypothetical protein BEP19_16835 [Ammoniphilus oxalaticus]|uniref:Uncharacterized protein n=1 Tax=Ammoniphilus oxalaticus TaxID=66863 RepID=A0A419SQ22_9BACL|nr:hypothetical protein [Ammoniphilus oxalaticus]RKD26502.1 hypothetical protein BEP19_16835 [Ammoniphilus oxalaticus]